MYFKMPLLLLVAVAAFGLKSCSESPLQGKNENMLMRVNHYQQTGVGEGLHLVYLVQEGEEIGGEQWSYFYSPIEGFDYEPGYVYELRLRKKYVENPPADGTSIRYILLNVISKTPVSETEEFQIRLKWGGENFITTREGENYLLGKYWIDCEALCEQLSQALVQDEEVTGTFVHGSESSLILQSLD